MKWKQTKQKLLAACGAALAPPQLSITATWHLFYFLAAALAALPGNPGGSSLTPSWKCLTPASWNQHCREGTAAIWLPRSNDRFQTSCSSLVPWDSFLLQDPGGLALYKRRQAFHRRMSILSWRQESVPLMGQGWDSWVAVPLLLMLVLHLLLCYSLYEQPCGYSY